MFTCSVNAAESMAPWRRRYLPASGAPVILVDGSDTNPGQRWYLLEAPVAVCARALSIYEKVYPLKDYNTRKAHREFLQTLKTILPDERKPILVTDAGFQGPSAELSQRAARYGSASMR